MGIVVGFQAKCYYGAAGSPATNELTNIRNLKLNLSKGEADVTTRGAKGWRQMVGTLKEGSVEFDMVWDTEDPGFSAIQAAWENDTPIAILALDGKNGSGLDADCAVLNFERDEQLEEGLTVSVSVKPTYSTRGPSWTHGTPTPPPEDPPEDP